MTRAKKELNIFSVQNLNNKEMEISRFVKESKIANAKKVE